MNLQEYKDRRRAIEIEAEQKKMELARLYAEYHNKYKVGDTVTDHNCTIEIEIMTVYMSFDSPRMKYYGIKITKQGAPNKKGEKVWVYGENIK